MKHIDKIKNDFKSKKFRGNANITEYWRNISFCSFKGKPLGTNRLLNSS